MPLHFPVARSDGDNQGLINQVLSLRPRGFWQFQMEACMTRPDGTGETINEYKARISSYWAGAAPLVLQAKAADTLAALVEGLSSDDLGKRPTPKKWNIREIVAHLADDEL